MRKFSSSTRAKIMAFAAAGLVLGVGGTVTLAAWVDEEWVYGGSGGDTPGVGTSEFIVEQNRSTPYVNELGSWQEFPDNPGGELVFTGSDPLALTPGDSTYSRVSLRTTVDSISGNVQLEGAVAAADIEVEDAGGALWNAIQVRVGVVEVDDALPAPTCDAQFFVGADFVDSGSLGDAFGNDIPIDAAGASYLHWCFELTLPSIEDLEEDDIDPTTLQGRTIAPAWVFVSTSVSV
jgi:predicted ribosomally synthesized peptide with SipW-like signal peptide